MKTPLDTALNRLVPAALITLAVGTLAYIFPAQTIDAPGIAIDSDLTSNQTVAWRLPESHPGLLSPISPYLWNFDFSNAEQLLADITYENGQLQITQKTLSQLQKATEPLLSAIEQQPTALDRIALLTEQTYAGDRGKQLSRLFVGYLRYTQYERSQPRQTTTLETHRQKEQQQRAYLGADNAQALFGKSNRMRRYLLQRRAIQRDPQLTDQQKHIKLQALTRPVGTNHPDSPARDNQE